MRLVGLFLLVLLLVACQEQAEPATLEQAQAFEKAAEKAVLDTRLDDAIEQARLASMAYASMENSELTLKNMGMMAQMYAASLQGDKAVVLTDLERDILYDEPDWDDIIRTLRDL